MQHLKQRRVMVGVAALAVALIFLIAAVLAARPPDDPFDGAAIKNPPFTSLTYGIQAFLWWDGGQVGMQLDWVRLMNFSHVKQVFAWRDMEPQRDQWDFSHSDAIVQQVQDKGLKLVARLSDVPAWAQGDIGDTLSDPPSDTPPANLDDWANYCGTMATRYKGRIDAYQIWNEPNLTREWGNRPPNAVEYTALLRACSQAIRAADPDAILISAGLAPTGNEDATAMRDDIYLQAMYDAGFQQYIDVVGAHAPGFSDPAYGPDAAERDGRGRWATFRRIEDLRKIMIRNGDAARQMAILETGWTTDTVHPQYAWYAVSDAQQAIDLVAAYQYAADHWRPWVGLMSAIYIAPPTWTPDNEEYWWAITLPNLHGRQAFMDMANMAKYCGDRVIPARAPDSPEAQGLVPTHPCD